VVHTPPSCNLRANGLATRTLSQFWQAPFCQLIYSIALIVLPNGVKVLSPFIPLSVQRNASCQTLSKSIIGYIVSASAMCAVHFSHRQEVPTMLILLLILVSILAPLSNSAWSEKPSYLSDHSPLNLTFAVTQPESVFLQSLHSPALLFIAGMGIPATLITMSCILYIAGRSHISVAVSAPFGHYKLEPIA